MDSRETWRRVVGFPNYEVSDQGRVRRGSRLKVLTPNSRTGYPYVTLCQDGKRKNATVHRLVLEAFVGNGDGMQARHLDGDRSNATLKNLAWGTQSDNELDKRRHGTAPIGSQHGGAKLTEADVRAIRSSDESQSQLARRYGVTASNISYIRSGKVWKHV